MKGLPLPFLAGLRRTAARLKLLHRAWALAPALIADAGEIDSLRQEFLLQGIQDFVAGAIPVQLRELGAAQAGDIVRTDLGQSPDADDVVEA